MKDAVFLIISAITLLTLGCQKGSETPLKTPEAQELKPTSFSAADLDFYLKDKRALAEGRSVYTSKCATCHGQSGEGNIGPNLTDDYWIHGGKAEQIANTVYNGVKEKGMIAWGALLNKKEILSVSAYVRSLRGRTPPNAKTPQGTKEEANPHH